MSLPPDLLNLRVMLANPGPEPEALIGSLDHRWVFDIKWDGIRCVAFIADGNVCLKNRNNVDITFKYPEVADWLSEAYPTGTRVFDGELICLDPATGTPNFNRIQKRDKQAKPAAIAQCVKSHPATFMVFDLLYVDGEDLRNTPLVHRHRLLKTEAERFTSTTVMVSQWSDDGSTLWKFACQFGLEGLIAKDKSAMYRGRRDSAWVKLKRLHRISCLVTGYEDGKGARSGRIGALLLSLLDENGKLVSVGKVGTGLKDRDHAPLLACLQRGEEFIVEVEALGFHEALRMPSFKGVRSDITRADCTLQQLEPLKIGA